MRDFDEALGTRAFDRVPQIVGPGITVSVFFHIGAKPGAPCIGTGETLQHRDHCFTLLVGDRIEGLAGLFDCRDFLDYRMRGRVTVKTHRPFAAIDAVDF